mmetsp:Transcript_1929/g.5429  ORF Transcript_1929/g.5429 Transcript_1929/m.5429 type:complete len:408 (-) Transcript_1929:801-2024(-)
MDPIRVSAVHLNHGLENATPCAFSLRILFPSRAAILLEFRIWAQSTFLAELGLRGMVCPNVPVDLLASRGPTIHLLHTPLYVVVNVTPKEITRARTQQPRDILHLWILRHGPDVHDEQRGVDSVRRTCLGELDLLLSLHLSLELFAHTHPRQTGIDLVTFLPHFVGGAPAAEGQGEALRGHEARQLNGLLAHVAGQLGVPEEKSLRRDVLLLAVGGEVMVLATPTSLQELVQWFYHVFVVLHAVHLDEARLRRGAWISELHHDVFRSCRWWVSPEHDLLLSIGVLRPAIHATARHKRPATVLHHEIHDLRGAKTNVALHVDSRVVTSVTEMRTLEQQVAEVWVGLGGARLPVRCEPLSELLVDPIRVWSADRNPALHPKFDHQMRRNDRFLRRRGSSELHLLLSDIA